MGFKKYAPVALSVGTLGVVAGIALGPSLFAADEKAPQQVEIVEPAAQVVTPTPSVTPTATPAPARTSAPKPVVKKATAAPKETTVAKSQTEQAPEPQQTPQAPPPGVPMPDPATGPFIPSAPPAPPAGN